MNILSVFFKTSVLLRIDLIMAWKNSQRPLFLVAAPVFRGGEWHWTWVILVMASRGSSWKLSSHENFQNLSNEIHDIKYLISWPREYKILNIFENLNETYFTAQSACSDFDLVLTSSALVVVQWTAYQHSWVIHLLLWTRCANLDYQ